MTAVPIKISEFIRADIPSSQLVRAVGIMTAVPISNLHADRVLVGRIRFHGVRPFLNSIKAKTLILDMCAQWKTRQ